MNGFSSKPVLYIPSPLHALAYKHAENLGFDLLLPGDPREKHWEDITTALTLRQGEVNGDLRKAAKGGLKIIARNGTGYDMIDIELCRELGIAVSNLPGKYFHLGACVFKLIRRYTGFNAEAVAEHTLAMCLSLTRRVAETDRKLRKGQTLRSVDFIGRSINGCTIGLVGMGAIARQGQPLVSL
jgi:lactate dehydrogenase-like 2-hydroxyacid dehydrogenase